MQSGHVPSRDKRCLEDREIDMNVRLHVLAILFLLGVSGAPAVARSSPDPASTESVPATSEAASAAHSAPADKATDDAIDRNLGDHRRYRAVIDALQKAVAADDAAGVAALVQYPIDVRIGGKKVTLKNRKMFVARYKAFMTPDIRKAIVTTTYGDLFVNDKGVMFGRGQAWINGICRDTACKSFDVKLVTLQRGPD
jgi:hypothetical protein